MDTTQALAMDGHVAMQAQGLLLRFLGLEAQGRAVTNALEQSFMRMIPRLNPGVVLEIGAHEAYFSLAMKRRLADTPVIAFEANGAVHAKHQARLAEMGVDYRHTAIAARDGSVTLRTPRRDGQQLTRMGSLMGAPGTDDTEEHEVAALALDSLHAQRAAMWIDVEGAIGEVLRGGEATFSTALAVMVELEEVPRWPGQMTARDVIDAMARHGLVPLMRDIQRAWQFNAVFVRQDMEWRVASAARDRYFAQLREIAGLSSASDPAKEGEAPSPARPRRARKEQG